MTDFDRIKHACLKRGELWEDPDFPATQSSVFYHQKPPFQFSWKRPKVSMVVIVDEIFVVCSVRKLFEAFQFYKYFYHSKEPFDIRL